jgi:signal transduction histidine kinase
MLMSGLVAVIEEFRHNSLIDVELQAGAIDQEPDPAVTAHLLGVVNEALSNIARHSGATRAMLWIRTDDEGTLRLMIQDNGHGFDPATTSSLGHQGLVNMRSRIGTIGATIDLASDRSGTTIEIRRPADESADDQSATSGSRAS